MRQETRHHHVVISWRCQISENILIATQLQTFKINNFVLTMFIQAKGKYKSRCTAKQIHDIDETFLCEILNC